MVLKMFSVLDVASDLYGNPWFMASKGEAVRAFSELVNDGKTMPGRYPEQFKLMQIGEFDNESGTVSQDETVSLGLGTDYIRKAPVALREVNNG